MAITIVETFYGPWSLEMVSSRAGYLQRVTIAGSDNTDGSFDYQQGWALPNILGEMWSIKMEWSSDGGSSWGESRVQRSNQITDADGLVSTLSADDGPIATADGDFDDLVITLKYLDQASNPSPTPKN